MKRYTDFSELTAPMINEFIEKIIVHEADRSSGERKQQVDIYLNFIGRFEVPEVMPAPEEIAEEEQAREKRGAAPRSATAVCREAKATRRMTNNRIGRLTDNTVGRFFYAKN